MRYGLMRPTNGKNPTGTTDGVRVILDRELSLAKSGDKGQKTNGTHAQ